MYIGEGISGALFSDDNHVFRYALWRIWNKQAEGLLFIGLNPSTANGTKDDPTIRRLISFAKSWGYGSLYCGNLFSIVSPDPTVLLLKPSQELPGGPNDTAIKQMREKCTATLIGWGNWGQNAGKRPSAVLAIVGQPVYCFAITKQGQPIHPLYLPNNAMMKLYEHKEE